MLKISNKIRNNNSGFTLIELVVVIAGLTALASFSIPSFLRSIKYNKIEEAKALMNGYALDCLNVARFYEGPYKSKTMAKTQPFGLSNERLEPLGYEIDGNGSLKYCDNVSIKARNKNEKDLYPFAFSYVEGKIEKIATPTDKNVEDSKRLINNYKGFLNSCKGWAGDKCGLTEEQKKAIQQAQELSKKKEECEGKFLEFLDNPGSGETVRWDDDKNSCTKPAFAYKGNSYNSAEEVSKKRDEDLDGECNDWRRTRMDSKQTSPNGNPETIDACNGTQFWFHSGREFEDSNDWKEYDNKTRKVACEDNRADFLKRKPNGTHTIGPGELPVPCGDILFFCNGLRLQTQEDFNNSSCGPPKKSPPPVDPPPPARCRKSPICSFIPSHPVCKCR